MEISITRTGDKARSYFSPKYKYIVHFGASKGSDNWPACIGFGFRTDANLMRRSQFSGYIMPEQFEQLARLMIEAEPQAAIRAFGAAMQAAAIQRAEPDMESQAA